MDFQKIKKTILRESLSASEKLKINDNEELLYIFFTDNNNDSDCSLEFNLIGDNSSVKIFGFNIGIKGISTIHVRVAHQNKNTTGHSWIKSVLGGDAQSTVRGMIKIESNALHTNAYFTHNSLLLSKDAQVVSVPSLEIETNEVKASHASTTGHLDNTILFYLKSRGIPEQEAKKIVVTSFTFEFISLISDKKIQERVSTLLNEKIAQTI